jgi:hypothetical protein
MCSCSKKTKKKTQLQIIKAVFQLCFCRCEFSIFRECSGACREKLVVTAIQKVLREYLNRKSISSMFSTINDCNCRNRKHCSAFANKICYMLVEWNLHTNRLLSTRKCSGIGTFKLITLMILGGGRKKNSTSFSAAPALQAAIDTASIAFAPSSTCI